jgi:hypothetical protein
MPYKIRDKEYHRVTEVTGAGECLATARGVKEGEIKIATTTPLAGIMTHLRIENRLKKMCGQNPKPLSYSEPTNLVWRKVRDNHLKQKKKDPDAVTSYETILKKAGKCWENFLDFLHDYPEFKPVCEHIESRVYSEKLEYAGTADIIFLMPMKGRRFHACHYKGGPNKEYKSCEYFLECDRDQKYKKEKDKRCPKYEGTGRNKVELTPCKCKWEMVISLGDWKTSSQKQKGHQRQLSAYHFACEEMGIWDKFRNMGDGKGGQGYAINWECWSLLFGDHKVKSVDENYRLHRYEPYINDFLESSRRFQNPRDISINERGEIGLKGRCMFCNHLLDCPDRVIWSNIEKRQIFTNPLTRSEINKGLIILEGLRKKGVLVEDLISKFKKMKRIMDITLAWRDLDDDIITDLTNFAEIPNDHWTDKQEMDIEVE